MTVFDLCRVTVQTHRKGQSVAVDLALPTRLSLGEVLPRLVDIVGDGPAAETNDVTGLWALARVDGDALDESMTLHESGVRDGDILLLTTQSQLSKSRYGDDLCHFVVEASAPADRDRWMSRRMAAIACLWAAGWSSLALGSCGGSSASSRAVIAALVAVTAAAVSVMASRVDPEPLPVLILGVTATAFAAIAGFLVVPGGPAPPNLFLAAAICVAMSTVLLHATSGGTPCFLAIAAFSTMSAIAAAVSALWPVPTATVGAVLAAASLAMLGVAARLAIVLTGLSPTMPLSPGEACNDGAVPADVGATRAVHGQQTLTGLLAGFSASAALGAALVAADQREKSALSGLCLTAVVSAVLLLRARQQRGTVRSAVVFAGGMVSASAAFAVAAMSLPRHAHWVCLFAVAIGVGALCLTIGDLASRISPVGRRSLELLDYLAVASVVPLACWVGDVFGIVRGLSLT
jgi:type VII secretion integral membrane protein EccD